MAASDQTSPRGRSASLAKVGGLIGDASSGPVRSFQGDPRSTRTEDACLLSVTAWDKRVHFTAKW
jgi:hypothetical protein